MQRDTRGYGKARIEILSLKGRVVPWREYGNNTDVFPPRKNTSSRPIRAKLNRVSNAKREKKKDTKTFRFRDREHDFDLSVRNGL